MLSDFHEVLIHVFNNVWCYSIFIKSWSMFLILHMRCPIFHEVLIYVFNIVIRSLGFRIDVDNRKICKGPNILHEDNSFIQKCMFLLSFSSWDANPITVIFSLDQNLFYINWVSWNVLEIYDFFNYYSSIIVIFLYFNSSNLSCRLVVVSL